MTWNTLHTKLELEFKFCYFANGEPALFRIALIMSFLQMLQLLLLLLKFTTRYPLIHVGLYVLNSANLTILSQVAYLNSVYIFLLLGMTNPVLETKGVINYYMSFISGSKVGGPTRLTNQLFLANYTFWGGQDDLTGTDQLVSL